DGLLDELPRLLGVRDIRLAGECLASAVGESAHNFFGWAFTLAIVDHHPRATVAEFLRDGASDATARACDDHDRPFKSCHVAPPSHQEIAPRLNRHGAAAQCA